MMGLKIVFMGTPEFAVHILERILDSEHEVVAVVTASDKPAGRGQKMKESPVKTLALEKNLLLFQPDSLKSVELKEALEVLNADVFVVVAFRMLPKVIWQIPRLGTFNLHASLLPDYRGAAPINWAIINRDTESGVTTFLIDDQIDTGQILLQEKVNIEPGFTAGRLHDVLNKLGQELVVKTLNGLESQTLIPKAQAQVGLFKLAPKLDKVNTRIDFEHKAANIEALIKGLNPYPTAWCMLEHQVKGIKQLFKIQSAEATDIVSNDSQQLMSDSDGILIPCSDFYLRVHEWQLEGKRKMFFHEFLAGNKASDWFTEKFV